MNLRCKPGDMAVIIGGPAPENIGVFVHITNRHHLDGFLAERFGGDDYWAVTSKSKLVGFFGQKRTLAKPGQVFCERDCFLQPIRGVRDLGETVEHTEIVASEASL